MPTPDELSIPEKLADIQTTKTAIREAIVAKGVEVPEGTTFRAYAEKIGEISGTLDGATVTFTDAVSFAGGLLVYALNPQLELVSLDSSGTLTIAVGTIAAMRFGRGAALYGTGDVEILLDMSGTGAVYVNGDGTITAQD